MRIWYVLPLFPVESETFVTIELRALQDLGHGVAVHAYAPAPEGASHQLAERGLEELSVEHGSWSTQFAGLLEGLRRPGLLLQLLAFVWRHGRRRPAQLLASLKWVPRSLSLYRRVEEERPDVVHLFWGHYPSLLGELVLTRLPDVVLTTSLASYDLTLEYRGSYSVARRAAMVRTWASANVPVLEYWGVPPERIVVEYQGIDLSRVPDPLPPKVDGRLVSVGRLIPDKGMDDVLRALARIRTAVPGVTLEVLGDGPDRRRLEALGRELGVAEAVHFAGHVDHRRVFTELAEAQVFLFLTRYDGERLPNVVKEAMICRCACVVNDSPGMDEFFEGVSPRDREPFVVLEPGDVEAAAEATLEILTEESSRTAVRTEAMARRVARLFDPATSAERLAAHWSALVQAREEGQPGMAEPAPR